MYPLRTYNPKRLYSNPISPITSPFIWDLKSKLLLSTRYPSPEMYELWLPTRMAEFTPHSIPYLNEALSPAFVSSGKVNAKHASMSRNCFIQNL